jgi:formimidoylglutamate deiminase
MAGLTERRGNDGQDSFWTWRALMYRFLEQLDPDAVEAIAALVQMEMLEAGYGCNVEFHYLHHGPDGTPYDTLAEMSERIVAAAGTSGIGLTLLPVHYQFGGCDGRPLGPGQRRFRTDRDLYARLQEGAAVALAALPGDATLGVAPHSLRAVAADDLPALRSLAGGAPFHMHLAEQPAEVEEVLAAYGQRPVDWSLDHMDPGPGMTLIHLTQMTPGETRRLAATGAIAGLCPITESSLGDGIFDGVRWLESGGRMAVGSDSNIRIALAEELRTLDYSQRLRDHSRAALALPGGSVGRRLFEAICAGGAGAAGRDSGRIAAGAWADLLTLDATHVDLVGRTGDAILDSWIFAGDDRMVRDVWSAGRALVRDGRHIRRDAIAARYTRTMAGLQERI